jgi:hypothetical protein
MSFCKNEEALSILPSETTNYRSFGDSGAGSSQRHEENTTECPNERSGYDAAAGAIRQRERRPSQLCEAFGGSL